MNNKGMDMLHGSLIDKICIFALPLALSSILQQLFNAADIAVVGRFASYHAMAAVGSNSAVISLLITLFTGLAVGANVVIARYIATEKYEHINKAVHTVMSLSLISGFFMLVFGIVVAKPILELINTPKEVINLATVYLRLYFLGMPFIMIYNFGSAILRAKGDSQKPLYCLIISGVVNILFNLLFVIVFDMSAAGVGLATTLSNAVSSAMIIYFLTHEKGDLKFEWKKLSLNTDYLKQIIQIGGPAGLQGMVFSLSNVVIQSAINGFGSNTVAAVSAAQNFEYFSYFVVNAFAQAAVTFTSQNYAAGYYDRCKKIYKISMICSLSMTFALSLTFIIFRRPLLSLYTTEEAVIKIALVRMLLGTTLECLTSTYEITGSCLRGMGYSMLPAIETVIGSCLIRLIYVYTIFQAYHSFIVLNLVYPITWIITGTMVNISYFYIRNKEFHKA